MGCRARQLTWPGHIESLPYQERNAYSGRTDSKSLQPSVPEYDPPFGLSPRVRQLLIALGIIDGYIEGLDEYLALESEVQRDSMSTKIGLSEQQ